MTSKKLERGDGEGIGFAMACPYVGRVKELYHPAYRAPDIVV
jgi:hypothetical protein